VLHVCLVKATGQDVRADHDLDVRVGASKVLQDLLLVLFCVLVADLHGVDALLLEALDKQFSMGNTGREADGLAWATEHLLTDAHVVGNHVAHDLQAALLCLVLLPLPGHDLDALHVDLFGDEHAKGDKEFLVDQLLHRYHVGHAGEVLGHVGMEWGSRQSNDSHVGAVGQELLQALPHDGVNLVDHDEVQLWPSLHALERLDGCNLYACIRSITPVSGHVDAVINPVFVQVARELVDQYPSVTDEHDTRSLLDC
jgi:hypothetical protein